MPSLVPLSPKKEKQFSYQFQTLLSVYVQSECFEPESFECTQQKTIINLLMF